MVAIIDIISDGKPLCDIYIELNSGQHICLLYGSSIKTFLQDLKMDGDLKTASLEIRKGPFFDVLSMNWG